MTRGAGQSFISWQGVYQLFVVVLTRHGVGLLRLLSSLKVNFLSDVKVFAAFKFVGSSTYEKSKMKLYII